MSNAAQCSSPLTAASFVIRGLDPTPFRPLFCLSDAKLAKRGIERHRVLSQPGVPDRISLQDLPAGQSALLLNYLHQAADTPYRASHAIYVGEQVDSPAEFCNVVPPALAIRPLSLRGFNAAHRIVDAELADPGAQAEAIVRLLNNPQIDYLHAHYARFGCFAARIDRLHRED